jgi:hypothetical protein
MSTRRRHPRGSALLIAIISVLVITVISVAILRFAGRESVGASAAAHEQALVACAEAARLQLMGQFHALGFQPSALTALNVPLSATTSAQGGHYDTQVGNIVIDQVTYLPESAAGPTSAARDLTGISSLIGQGGKPMKVVVHCQDGVLGGGRQLEVEFGIRFGL